MVYASGVAEIAGGVGMMVPARRRLAGWWLIATMVGVFPANLHMALNAERFRGLPGGAPALWARLPLQGRVHRLDPRRDAAAMIGQRIRRREDPRFITGHGQYVDDLVLPGALHAAFVRSDWAHGRITEIDASEALALPGVQVFTGADVPLDPLPAPAPMIPEAMQRPPIAVDRVRFVGEIVAVVLAESRAKAEDAAQLVYAEIEPLPVVVDPEQALRGETLLFDGLESNVALADGPPEPSDDLFAGCEVITEGPSTASAIHVAPIEPRATAARFEDGRLTTWLCTQTPHQDRDGMAAASAWSPTRSTCSPRRRRRLRRQDADGRGRDRRLAGARERPAGPLDRDAL